MHQVPPMSSGNYFVLHSVAIQSHGFTHRHNLLKLLYPPIGRY